MRRRTREPGKPATGGELKAASRSEEHTSELQSLRHLVCRLLLEKQNEADRKSTRLNSSHLGSRMLSSACEKKRKMVCLRRRAAAGPAWWQLSLVFHQRWLLTYRV